MTSSVSLHYWNARLQSSQPRKLTLMWTITGAKAATDLGRSPTMYGFDAGSFASQAAIDAYLGTTNEFLLAAFDSTAMGADVFAGIVNMSEQCAELYYMTAYCYSASNTIVTRQVEDSATLTSSSLTTECAKGADGNVAFRIDFGNTPDFDGLTAGTIQVDLFWRAK